MPVAAAAGVGAGVEPAEAAGAEEFAASAWGFSPQCRSVAVKPQP